MSNKNLKEEYTDLSTNLRHYGNIRFAGLTIFLAVTAALVNFIFSTDLSVFAKTVFKFCGICLTLLFFFVDISDMYLWTRFMRRAAKLEKSLSFKQYSSLPGAPEFKKFRPATLAIWGFYVLILLFWLVTMVWSTNFEPITSSMVINQNHPTKKIDSLDAIKKAKKRPNK